MLDSAEKNIQSAKQILREMMGTPRPVATSMATERAKVLVAPSAGKIIEGVFDGQNMMGQDGKKYPVPANYASKSKLLEGDVLKLTISDDGSFIYKQIGPVEREKKLGLLSQTENGEYRVTVDGRSYRVLLASLTYFKAEPGDEVAIVVPQSGDAQWAAVENVIKSDGTQGPGAIADAPKERMVDIDRDLELGEQE